jgi:hypothetical protein
VGYWKIAEIELKRKLTAVLGKLGRDRFCTMAHAMAKPSWFSVNAKVKGKPIDHMTLGNIEFAVIKSNAEVVRRMGWPYSNDCLDLSRFDSVWKSTEMTLFLSKILTLRNDYAHIGKMGIREYDEMRDLMLDVLLPRLAMLGRTRDEEKARKISEREDPGAPQRIAEENRTSQPLNDEY